MPSRSRKSVTGGGAPPRSLLPALEGLYDVMSPCGVSKSPNSVFDVSGLPNLGKETTCPKVLLSPKPSAGAERAQRKAARRPKGWVPPWISAWRRRRCLLPPSHLPTSHLPPSQLPPSHLPPSWRAYQTSRPSCGPGPAQQAWASSWFHPWAELAHAPLPRLLNRSVTNSLFFDSPHDSCT